MKKLLLVILLLSAPCIAQDSKKTYSIIYTSESMNKSFSKAYEKYVAEYFYQTTGKKRIIERDPVLDTVAAGRSEYSVLVFKESSKNTSFRNLLDYVPPGARGHKRLYDTPSVFKEPKGCIFPDKDNLPILKRNNLDWSSELFVEDAYSYKTQNGNVDNAEVIEKYVRFMRKTTASSSGDSFLDSYLRSTDHKNAIHKYGNWKFGCSTMLIISKQYLESSGMWKYDVFVCHTIIILKNYTDSNVY